MYECVFVPREGYVSSRLSTGPDFVVFSLDGSSDVNTGFR